VELRGLGDAGLAFQVRLPRGSAWIWGGLTMLCLFRLWAASRVSLFPDEAYYWVWSRALAAGYFDHPPMVALWIRAGTAIAGQTALGVRLLGPISQLVAAWLIARTARDLLPEAGEQGWLGAGLLMNATLFWGVAGEVMTPDVPLLFFWVAALWAMGRLIATGQAAWWLAVGLFVGLALASKYTAILFPAGILIWMLEPSRRFWWRSPWPYFGGAIATALFAPVLWWNFTHHWASFVRQGGRLDDFKLGRALGSEFGLVFGQIAAATPVVAALCALGAVAVARRWREPAAGLLAAMIWPGAALFVEHALGDRVQANWPAVLYPAAVIAAGLVASRWRWPGIWFGLAVGGLVLVQFAFGLVRLPRNWSVVPMRPETVREFTAGIAQAVGNSPYIATDDYGLAALLAWYLPGNTQVLALDYRWPNFDLPPAEPVIRSAPGILMLRLRPDPGSHWADKTLFERLPSVRGQQIELLYHLSGIKPGDWQVQGAVMPRRDKIVGD